MVEQRNDELTMEPLTLEMNAKCSIQERIDSLGDIDGKVSTNSNTNSYDDSNEEEIDRGFRPLTMKRRFMHEYEVLIGPRGPPAGAISSSGPNSGRSSGGMSSSPQGYFAITPFCRCNDMGIVLVNRGWVPRQYGVQNVSWGRPRAKETIVTGVASKTECELPFRWGKLL